MDTSTDQPTPSTDLRSQRGLAIVTGKGKRIRQIVGKTYLVPSQTNDSGGYVVKIEDGTCTCPDYELRGGRCKHQWAVLIIRREVTMPDGSVATSEHRYTYPQNWPAYNAAQCEEKARVQILLKGLCDGIVQAPQKTGRPRLPLADVIYGAALKVYSTVSGRRASTDIRESAKNGMMEHAPHYNSLFRYVEQPSLLPLLTLLVEESATPLRSLEQKFAADSTGFATNTYARWFDHRYGSEQKQQRWVKAHAMIGTVTNVITAVKVTEGSEADCPVLPELLAATKASGFGVKEVSADKAYLSNDNFAAIEAAGATPYIPFKSNSSPTGNTEAWNRLWHYYSLNKSDFAAHYHQRSNVESTFSAVKRKFGGMVRSKITPAQYNEVLLKCLCYNLSMLVHSIHEFGIEPKFWMPQPEAA